MGNQNGRQTRRGGRRKGAGRKPAPLVHPELARVLTPEALGQLTIALIEVLYRSAIRGNVRAMVRYLAGRP